MTVEHHPENVDNEQKLREELVKRISEFISDQTDRDEVLATVEKLIQEKGVKAVLVSGSYATKTKKPTSDLDLVVLQEQQKPPHNPNHAFTMRLKTGQLKKLNKGGDFPTPWIDLIYFDAKQAQAGKFSTEEAVLIRESSILFSTGTLVEDAQNHAQEQTSLKKLLTRDWRILGRKLFGAGNRKSA